MTLSKQELQLQLTQISTQRKEVEDSIANHKNEFVILQNLIAEDFLKLEELQAQEREINISIFNIQKEEIKDSLSMNGIKKLFAESSVFNKVKSKALQLGKDVSVLFNEQTSFDTTWLESQYSKYKEICLSKGQAITEKEDFKKITGSIKSFKISSPNLKFEDFFNSVSDFSEDAKEHVKAIWDNYSSDVVENTDELPIDKKEAFLKWFDTKITKSTDVENDRVKLYEDYINFLNSEYNEDLTEEEIYSWKAGSFTQILKKTYKLKYTK